MDLGEQNSCLSPWVHVIDRDLKILELLMSDQIGRGRVEVVPQPRLWILKSAEGPFQFLGFAELEVLVADDHV